MPVDPTVLTALTERLAAQLTELFSGQEWLDFLASSRRFHRYSPQNQMLLMLQGADGHVASYRTWQRTPAQGGGSCQVRKGEHGLVILAPITLTRREIDEVTGEEITVTAAATRFKPVKVFHQGQLVAPPDLPEPPLPELLTGANRHQHVWGAVQSQLEALGYTVDKVLRSPVETWNGRTDFIARSVVVSDHLEPPAALKTLFHEWAHIVLGHEHNLVGHHDLQEVEAESVAYMLCAAIGVDSSQYSVPYLASWSNGDATLLQATAQRTLAATAGMIDALEDELSVDLTPDLYNPRLTHAPPPINRVLDAEPTTTRGNNLVESPRSTDTPLLDAADGEIRNVMAGLDGEHDRARLVTALADLDRQLATALELFADAGINPTRAARFMINEAHLDREVVVTAMIADELDHHPHAPDVPTEDVARITADMRAAVAAIGGHSPVAEPDQHPKPATSDPLSVGDRYLLTHMDLTRADCLTAGCRALHDAGLDIDQARDVLTDLGVDPHRAATALLEPRYNPASGRGEPLWAAEPDHSDIDREGAERNAAAQLMPPHDVVQRVAATGEPVRLVQLSDAFGLDHSQSIQLWASAGLTADVVAKASIAAHAGDIPAAVADLAAHWPAETVNWQALTAVEAEGPAAPVSTSAAIVRQWSRMAVAQPATNAPAPEMA